MDRDKIMQLVGVLEAQKAELESGLGFHRNWLEEVRKAYATAEENLEIHTERNRVFLSKRASAIIYAERVSHRSDDSIAAHVLLDEVADEIDREEHRLHAVYTTAKEALNQASRNVSRAEEQIELAKREIDALGTAFAISSPIM